MNHLVLRRLCNRLLYALLALVVVVVVMRALGTQSLVGTPFGFLLGAIGLAAGVTYFFSIYQLSRRLSNSPGTAWLLLCLQVIPIIGLPVAISLLFKANAIAAAQERKHLPQSAAPDNQRDA